MAEYYTRVHEFESILRNLLSHSDIWDNVFVLTDIDSYAKIPFYGVTSEDINEYDDFDEVYYDLKIRVVYTDYRGEQQERGYIFTTTNFNLMLEVEEKSRKIIPMIYE